MLALSLNKTNRIVIIVPPSTAPQRVEFKFNPKRRSGRDRASIVFDAPREIRISRKESPTPSGRPRNPRRAA